MTTEFEVPGVSKKVARRYRIYAGWLRYPGLFAILLLYVLFIAGYFIFRIILQKNQASWDGLAILGIALWGFSLLLNVLVLLILPLGQRPLFWGNRSEHWQYVLDERSAQMYSKYGILQRWEYHALAYAREAKDAFYLVTNEASGQAMIIPKEALSPEVRAMLVDFLTKGMPEKKFTRWRGAARL